MKQLTQPGPRGFYLAEIDGELWVMRGPYKVSRQSLIDSDKDLAFILACYEASSPPSTDP